VIVGLTHKSIGHLGIFVSGKVAKKEHTQIVSVLETIERLNPGLYGMMISEHKGAGGQVEYEVEFQEYRLEEIAAKLNRFQRVDEKPFEAVEQVSEFNQRAYELFAQPAVQAMSNDFTARLLRQFHPLRVQHWAISDVNPWLAWLGPAAKAVRENRKTVEPEQPLRQLEKIGSDMLSASLDLYRGMRDAGTEASFFGVYANMFSMFLGDKREAEAKKAAAPVEPRELPFVKEALASIAQGGYAEAFARTAALLMRHGEPLPLSLLETRDELATDYAQYLPVNLAPDQFRRIRGEQEIITRYEPEQAVLSLSTLLADPEDRRRLLTVLDKLIVDPRVQALEPSAEQLAMLERIRSVLGARPTEAERRTKAAAARTRAQERRNHSTSLH
jgi:hypothetical protein